MEKWQEGRDIKHYQLEKKAKEKEDEVCTFQPETNKKSK